MHTIASALNTRSAKNIAPVSFIWGSIEVGTTVPDQAKPPRFGLIGHGWLRTMGTEGERFRHTAQFNRCGPTATRVRAPMPNSNNRSPSVWATSSLDSPSGSTSDAFEGRLGYWCGGPCQS
jgi:hypothetical protein